MSLQRTMTTTMSFQKSFAASGLQLTACASMQCTTTSSGSAFQQSSCNTSLGMRIRRTMSLRRTLTTSPTTLGAQLQQHLPTVTFKKKKEQLDNLQNAANFYSAASKTKLHTSLGVQLQLRDADSTLRGQLIRPLQRASTEACQEYRGFSLAASFRSRIDSQLPRKQLDRRDLQQDSFQDSSSTEETFSETTSQTAAWQKRASDRQLLPQQLGRRDLHKGNFRDSSLEEETFSTAASKKAAWKRHFALATTQSAAWQLSLEQPSFQTRTSRIEPLELQRRTSSTELSELERTALHTELAELERPALTTALAQLETSSFEEGSSDLNFEEPSFIAQLCLYLGLGEASSLGGAQLRTAELQGGVLSRASPMHSLTLTSLGLPHFVAQASPGP